MPRRHRDDAGPQVTIADRLWLVGLLLVAFADVVLVLVVLPLFD